MMFVYFVFWFTSCVGFTDRESTVRIDALVKSFWDDLQKLGYHSVNADPGVYTGWATLQRHEQTIYREDQQTFMYILDVK